MFKIITTAVVGAALAFSSAAHSESWFQLEAGIGGSAYSRGADGYWLQEAFPHKLQLTAPAVEVGITGDLYTARSWGISYHIGYAWLGTVHTDAEAVPLDSDYSVRTKTCNAPCLPLARYQGSGHEAGFILSLEPYYRVGNWRLGVEAGPFIHKTVWTEDVSNIVYDNSQSSPISLRYTSSDGWRVGMVVGASVSYKDFSIAYQHFLVRPTGNNPGPAIWHSVDMLAARYRF